MLRALIVASVTLAIAGPVLADDDMDACRDRRTEAKMRLEACERVIAAGRVTGKDLGLANAVRAQAFMQKHNYNKAIAAFDAAIAADPDNLDYSVTKGWAYYQKGDDDQAMAIYNALLQAHPNAANALNNRGRLYLRKGALQSALDDFTAALNYRPDYHNAHLNRGIVLRINGDLNGALADIAKGLQTDAPQPYAYLERCRTYIAMGRFDEAMADCNTAIEKAPNYQHAVVGRADIYRAKGDLDAALKDYNSVLGKNPNNMLAHVGRGQLLEKRRDLVQAREDYRLVAAISTPHDDYDITQARETARDRLAALTPQGPAGTIADLRVALIIGNGAYKHAPALGNPPRDAKLMADTLRGLGFKTVTLASDLTHDKFVQTLRAFAREAEKADWAVIYYAGHGLEVGGTNYLVPVDAKLASDKDAETEAVPLDQLLAAAGGARRLRLVMLDACRDNPFAPKMQRTMELKLVDKGLSDIEPSAGFMVVYAAKHGETALDGEGVDSPFAVAVTRDIKQPHVEVRKLFDIVRDDVWTATKHAQEPFTYGSPPGRDDFYFVAGK
jgi:tetratricopeptide (TPR) repeat protein